MTALNLLLFGLCKDCFDSLRVIFEHIVSVVVVCSCLVSSGLSCYSAICLYVKVHNLIVI